MANNRASAQKRAKQNRNQRAALEARTKGQPPKRPSRVAPATAEKLANKNREADSTDAKKDTGDKPRRVRPPRPGDTPVDVATLEGSWFTKVRQVPGGGQVIQAGLMTVVVTGMLFLIDLYSSDAAILAAEAKGEDRPKPDLTLLEWAGTVRGLLLIAVPVLAVAVALRFSLHPQRRRIWFGAMFVVMLSSLFLQFYLVVVGFLGYACYKASKVEGRNESLFRRGRRKAVEGESEPVSGKEAEV